MARLDPEARDPVDRPAALGAVEYEPTELPLEIGLHLQEFKAQHLRLERDGMGSVEARLESLVDDRARGCRLFAYGPDRPFEDVPIPCPHVAEANSAA